MHYNLYTKPNINCSDLPFFTMVLNPFMKAFETWILNKYTAHCNSVLLFIASEAEVIQQQRNTTPSGSAVPPCYQQQHQQTQLRRRRRVSGPTAVSVGDVTGATPAISVGVSSSTGSTGSPRAQAGEAK